MSTPVAMAGGAQGGVDDVGAFVAEVRSQLDDLSLEEIDELTGGLEADLADALAEEGRPPREQFGDPAAYAAELRAAAGLAPRPTREQHTRSAFGRTRGRVAGWRSRLTAQPWWPPLRDFLLVLRPTWWVLRAVVAAQLLWVVLAAGTVLTGGLAAWVLLIAFIVVSVQMGRRRLQDRRGWGLAIRIGNVLAVLLLPFALNAVSPSYGGGAVYQSPPVGVAGRGLINGDTPVRNVFAYDAQGRPLRDVQLFDQDGRPLEVGEYNRSWADDQNRAWQLVPRTNDQQQQRWNTFPLQRQEYSAESGAPVGAPQNDVPPLVAVPPRLAPPTATATTTPSAGPAPTAPTPGAASPSLPPAAPSAAPSTRAP